MKVAGALIRGEEVEFFLRLHGLWEGATDIPPPPEPPFDIETIEPIRTPPPCWQPFGYGPQPGQPWTETDASRWDADADDPGWRAPELALDDERVLVLDGDPLPPDD